MSFERHAENRNALESLLRHIPGFHGYLEKEYRREADHMLRMTVAERLDGAKGALDTFIRQRVEQAQLDDLPMCERLRSRIDGLISRLRSAVRGYSGFFDYVQVDEELLDRMYDHDLTLLGDAQRLVEAIQEQLAKGLGPPALSAEILPRIEKLESHVSQRAEMLEGRDAPT